MESRFGGCLPFDEFVSRCTHFPLKEILHAYGVTDSRIRAVFPQYIELLDEIYTEENLPALKAYLLTHTAYSAEGLSPDTYCIQRISLPGPGDGRLPDQGGGDGRGFLYISLCEKG